MRTEEETLTHFKEWARYNELIRAAVLTSSRADPNAGTDWLSDYDIGLYVSDIGPFLKDDEWLNIFGPVLVRWPYRPRSTFSEDWLTRLVLFSDGVRIDFQITAKKDVAPDTYDNGYRVLLDKDDLLKGLDESTFSKFVVKKPSREEYETLVHEFWWDATYVPKYLWRDELPFAKHMLGQSLQDSFLRTMIEWHIGLQHNWSVNTGACGRKFKKLLDSETWSEFESTYAGPGIEDNWQAFLNAVTLFGRLARIVGNNLGYAYPAELEKAMRKYYEQIRNAKRLEV